MSSFLSTIGSLLTAGSLIFSCSIDAVAPHQDSNGLLFLLNRQYAISSTYVPELATAQVSGQLRRMRPDAANALEEMFKAAKKDGIPLMTISGYRSWTKQETIYNNKLKSVGGSVEKANEYVALPGASEHQSGMAMDVAQSGKEHLTTGFANTEGGKWIAEHCWEYGFILRYKEEWVDETGYQYEPWHVRYVGRENAAAIHEQDIPLESYLINLRSNLLLDTVIGARK